MRIRFLSDQVYDTGGPGLGPRFTAGTVLDSSDVATVLALENAPPGHADGFLQRWLNRGVAEQVDGRTPTTREIAAREEAMATKQAAAKAPEPEAEASAKIAKPGKAAGNE